jgi:hypothetical protein
MYIGFCPVSRCCNVAHLRVAQLQRCAEERACEGTMVNADSAVQISERGGQKSTRQMKQ